MIILLGASFDPVHNGHLGIARCVYEHFKPEELSFLPCHQDVEHKSLTASMEDRHAMLLLALEKQSGFTLDFRELVLPYPSYTVGTLTEIRKEIGNDMPVGFIIGSDIIPGLSSWHYWKDLLKLTHLIIVTRSVLESTISAEIEEYLQERTVTDKNLLKEKAAGFVYFLDMTPINISSSKIREAIKQGKSISQWVPKAVDDYINTHKLYR